MFPRIVFLLVFTFGLALPLMFAAGEAEPVRTMPTAGPDGVGFCVRLPEFGFTVMAADHVINVEKRIELNAKGTAEDSCSPQKPCSTDPGFIVKEYRESVRSAIHQAALVSGSPTLSAMAEGPLSFPDLGDAVTPEDTIIYCYKSDCYGQPPTCVPTDCGGACADCVVVLAPGGGGYVSAPPTATRTPQIKY